MSEEVLGVRKISLVENSVLFEDIIREVGCTRLQIDNIIRTQECDQSFQAYHWRREKEQAALVETTVKNLQSAHLSLCEVHKSLYTLCLALFVVFLAACLFLVLCVGLLRQRVDGIEEVLRYLQERPLVSVPISDGSCAGLPKFLLASQRHFYSLRHLPDRFVAVSFLEQGLPEDRTFSFLLQMSIPLNKLDRSKSVGQEGCLQWTV